MIKKIYDEHYFDYFLKEKYFVFFEIKILKTFSWFIHFLIYYTTPNAYDKFFLWISGFSVIYVYIKISATISCLSLKIITY